MIDLRSDTVTKPTPQMLNAMMSAELGDDVLGDDPTVAALEARIADLLGKPAAAFVPSGTMANQLAIRAQTEPGCEIIVGRGNHIYFYEGGAAAALSGVTSKEVGDATGMFSAKDLKAVLRPTNYHYPPTRMVCIENTHNQGGGLCWPIDRIVELSEVARDSRLRMHLDGARLLNACVATGLSPRDYAAHFDTISVCFSKGLGAPVGSALVGDAETIDRAKRFRKQFGGGMRQSGLLAAAALYALDHHIDRLADDHANAKKLAAVVADSFNASIDLERIETNIVRFSTGSTPASKMVERLAKHDVHVLAVSPTDIRMVTHLGVSNAQVDTACGVLRDQLNA